jgi:hypothetical protein
VPSGVKLTPHRHPADRIYTVMSGVFYISLGEQFDGGAAGLGNDVGAGFRTEHGALRRVDLSTERGAVLLSAQLALRKPTPRNKLIP